MIKEAKDRLILISPFLRLNDRVKELLADKNRLKIDVRIVYGKSELQPEEIGWLNTLSYVRTSFCRNLHAKCYLNEELCIVTSLNLYEFSQVNNNEMGVLIRRSEDSELYRDAYEECQRIIRISEEVRIALERVATQAEAEKSEGDESAAKLTSSKLGQRLKLKTAELMDKLVSSGHLEIRDGKALPHFKGERRRWRVPYESKTWPVLPLAARFHALGGRWQFVQSSSRFKTFVALGQP